MNVGAPSNVCMENRRPGSPGQKPCLQRVRQAGVSRFDATLGRSSPGVQRPPVRQRHLELRRDRLGSRHPGDLRGRDYRTQGDKLWKRFNGGRDGTLWYFRELAKAYRKTGRSPLADDVSREVRTLQRLVRVRANPKP